MYYIRKIFFFEYIMVSNTIVAADGFLAGRQFVNEELKMDTESLRDPAWDIEDQ
jgi:hypothetical protein